MKNKVLIIVTVLFKLVTTIDYCGLCENGTHTMCKYKGPAENCYGYRRTHLSSREKKYIVDIHNDIRNHVASGMEARGALGSQPPAAEMPMLEWDEELAEIAQRWADQCVRVNETLQHDLCKRTERFEVGQNILTAITNEPDMPELSVLIFNWYQQVTNVVPSDIDLFVGVRKGKYLIGQYTQLVWSETRYVGCGLATFTEFEYDSGMYQHRLVCNYGPAGNVIGEAVYQRGPPCSKCPTRQCDAIRRSLCQGTQSKTHKTAFNYPENEDFLQLNNAIFNLSISNIIAENKNNFTCLNPDDSKKTSCIKSYISNANISNSFNPEHALKYITFTDLSLDNSKLAKPNQKTLKNLIALWKKLKLKNFTDLSDFALSMGIDENFMDLNDINKNVNNVTLTKVLQKSNESDVTKSTEDFLKNVTYLTTVIPSITMPKSILEDIVKRNTTIIQSSQDIDIEKPSIIQENTDMYGFMLMPEFKRKRTDLDLDNGVVLGDSGEKHYRNSNDQKKIIQSYLKLNQEFSDMADLELPSTGHFRKAKGTWHDGHCRCEAMLQSSKANLNFNRPIILLMILIYMIWL